MPSSPIHDWQIYREAVRGGRKAVFDQLRDRVVAANQAGLGRAALIDELNRLLKDIENAKRDEDFEVVAEMIQRVSGFFSPHGIIQLKD